MAAEPPATLADEFAALGDGALRPTRRVVIVGLVSRDDLNGLEAIILPGDRRGSAPNLRLPVRTSLGNEKILVRVQNLTASASLAVLGDDGLFACFLRFKPDSALLGRLVCRLWRMQLTHALGNREWQATHLPLPVLCRAAAWPAAMLRLGYSLRANKRVNLSTRGQRYDANEARRMKGYPKRAPSVANRE